MRCMEIWGGNQTSNSHLTRPGLDISIWSQSQGYADAGGSDLHLLSSCASGRITRILLADVCGFGSLFAEIAGELRELMKRHVNSLEHARCVRELSRRLEAASRRGAFASTVVTTYFAPTRTLDLCNAGHPPPLLFRSSSQTWSALKRTPEGTAAAVGHEGVVHRGDYQQFQLQLELGDMLLSYSEPLTEARDASGGLIGLEGLLSRVRQLDRRQPAEIATNLATRIGNEHDDNLSEKDVTVLLCRASDTRVGWRDNLLAPLRLLRAVTDQTRLE